jgi:anti-sigma B factor antagonist
MVKGRVGGLKVDIERTGGASVARLQGELDLSTANDLESALAGSGDDVVLDLRGLEFIDSAGLRAVLSLEQRLRRAGGRLRLVPGPESVQQVFTITGLEARLEFEPPGQFPG